MMKRVTSDRCRVCDGPLELRIYTNDLPSWTNGAPGAAEWHCPACNRQVDITPAELDPRWNWVELIEPGKPESTWVRGRCKHQEVVPVESGGEVVAQLCTTCDTQLPAPREDMP